MSLDSWFQPSKNDSNIINGELIELEMKYGEMFGHAVPREVVPAGISQESIIAALKTCIETQKDDFLDILGVKLKDGFLY